MIIGIDISTSCTGICILNDDGTFQSIHHVDLKKEKDFYKKVDEVIDFIVLQLHVPLTGVRFYIEAPLLHFKMKASMASTIALLQKFNACVCYGIYSAYNIEPKLINVLSARKAVGIELPRKKKKKEIKPMIFSYVRSLRMIPESTWQYKRTGTPKDFCYDMADAFVIARAGYVEESRR